MKLIWQWGTAPGLWCSGFQLFLNNPGCSSKSKSENYFPNIHTLLSFSHTYRKNKVYSRNRQSFLPDAVLWTAFSPHTLQPLSFLSMYVHFHFILSQQSWYCSHTGPSSSKSQGIVFRSPKFSHHQIWISGIIIFFKFREILCISTEAEGKQLLL